MTLTSTLQVGRCICVSTMSRVDMSGILCWLYICLSWTQVSCSVRHGTYGGRAAGRPADLLSGP
eukprot:9339-Eustigmatos_ZCMA.PRE.1